MRVRWWELVTLGLLSSLLAPVALELRAVAGEPSDATAFWAFQPVADPEPPMVADESWARTGLDRFVLARLEAAGLRPAPPADRRTLIRRVTFDLIGLPPTPEEIDAFLEDDSPEAFARVVERLLASPHYGERWGRHWLDVARYAESNGLDENVAHGNAWRYRDYVIASFNRDKPFDDFVREQLAGDLLPADDAAQRRERLIATGFLALGPKVLAEPDEAKMEMDIVDEQIETVGRAFLGLTLGCARCHDHMYDPIPTEDYYALAGIFQSTRTMENFKKVARWHENAIPTEEDLARQADHERAVAARRAAIAELIAAADADRAAESGGAAEPSEDAESHYPPEVQAELKRLRDELAALEQSPPVMPTAMGAAEADVVDSAVHVRGSTLTLGSRVPRRVPSAIMGPPSPSFPTEQSGRLQLADWLVDPDHPLTARVLANRIWRWHFGRGLSGSPDNFGSLGDPPTHPELLDWLARRLIEDGWSIKAMHRRIVLSSTYQMSSTYDEAAAQADPDNRLRWRWQPRRLEAEAIRDALLVVSGELDPTFSGSLLHVGNREYLFDHTSRDKTRYDSRRRSLYLPVIRNNLYDLFQLFDFADASVPNGDRPTSTVAPQALFLLNSDLVTDLTERMAERLLAEAETDAGRIARLYLTALGRPPRTAEVGRGLAFLEQAERLAGSTGSAEAATPRLEAWRGLCHVVVAGNEFIYLR